jgi:hypothetical protein
MPKQSFLELLAAGHVALGTELVHVGRRHPRHDASAVVVRGGIQVGSTVFASPSGAARAITGKPEDGWLFWRIRPSGARLDVLRGSDSPLNRQRKG